MIDDGNAVYLVFNMKETTSETILLNGFDDIPHLMIVDGHLWFSVLIRAACFDFDEV